jgi:PIN domain
MGNGCNTSHPCVWRLTYARRNNVLRITTFVNYQSKSYAHSRRRPSVGGAGRGLVAATALRIRLESATLRIDCCDLVGSARGCVASGAILDTARLVRQNDRLDISPAICNISGDMRTVLDTDVMVSAFRSRTGASRTWLRAGFRGDVALLLSMPLVLQYEEVLTRPEHLEAAGTDASARPAYPGCALRRRRAGGNFLLVATSTRRPDGRDGAGSGGQRAGGSTPDLQHAPFQGCGKLRDRH